ncbi:MAG: peptidylprolyl isomerase [Chryseotalea sp. WA131a]|jgi:cyclophilin family peptidyl-prolyl cis-trans isomerase|nr:MAG: peptidylprolyl isomerase [Chryseotalea sp. WA131a]
MNKSLIAFSLLVLSLVSSCAQKSGKSDYVVTIKTSYGDMVAILYDETPKHKANFIKLAKEHYFDSLLFHRVIAEFMIQGGDPDSKRAQPGQLLGQGGPGYTVDAEFNPNLFHEKGALSAARLGDEQNPTKASSGSQFYIVQGTVILSSDLEDLRIDQMKFNTAFRQVMQNPANQPLIDTLNKIYLTGDMQAYKKKIFSLVPRIEKETGMTLAKFVSPEKIKAYTTVGGAPHLDGGYTVFGKVIKGLEIIDKIASVQTNGERPLEDIRMVVMVEEMPKSKITKLYGYVFTEAPNK